MKKFWSIVAYCLTGMAIQAQVTQINSNKSLYPVYPISNSKTILSSEIDSSLWVTDGTPAGTTQLSASIKFDNAAGLIAGKLLFTGITVATGAELYITDGTSAGTLLVKDIYAGASSSTPADFTFFNGTIYFSAATLAEGRELWKTDGTNAGTTLVKDIAPGTGSSNESDRYELFTAGSFMLFAANTAGQGLELWKSDGTNAGTVLLKDINSGADSSAPRFFTQLNNTVLFVAKDATNGDELWKTDGTAAGTVLVKDVNTGPAGSTSFEFFPGFGFSIFQGFHVFNNKAYFRSFDGVSSSQIWTTNGTTAGTTLVKDIAPGSAFPPIIQLFNAVNLPGKFIFGVSDGNATSELWQCDGTPAGTTLFKSFSFGNNNYPFILINYQFDFVNGTVTTPLFQGNKFFFTAATTTEGNELWISDGTLANTKLVKDIKPGTGSGIDFTFASFKADTMYFAADDGVKGNELWKTDGTAANTTLVADINTGTGNSDPSEGFFTVNNKLLLIANNGDNAATDLYVLGGVTLTTTNPCPGGNFSISANISGASYQWQVNTGSGFTNISNNSNYAGATTATLQISNMPSAWYGYQYRCNVNGSFSTITTLKFVNTWRGTANNLWNNPANWSCNVVPDSNTDVVVVAGNPVVNVNSSCRSITVSNTAAITVNTGISLLVAK